MKNIVIVSDDNQIDSLLHALELSSEAFNVICIYGIESKTSVTLNEQTLTIEKFEKISHLPADAFDIILNENFAKDHIASALSQIFPTKIILDFSEFEKRFFSTFPYMQQRKEAIRQRYASESDHPCLTIGDFTYGAPDIITDTLSQKCCIGKFCSVARNVTVVLCADHRGDWMTTYPFNVFFPEFSHIEGHPTSNGDVIIGNDVWIATGAVILSGVTTGDGCIIGANTVVNRSIPPYSVVVGNPGRIIKTRFPEETISLLLEMKWWDWSDSDIYHAIPLLQNCDFQQLYEYYRNHVISAALPLHTDTLHT